MSLNELEQTILAYYVANGASDLNMVGRFWPYGELVMIIEDKVQLGVRKYGTRAKMAAPKVARAYADLQIEKGGFSTVDNNFGGKMHQFQGDAYKAALAELQANDPIVQQAQAAGDGFWEAKFAELTAR